MTSNPSYRTAIPTVPTLRKRLKDYKQRCEGTANRPELVQRLKDYSEDSDHWSRYSGILISVVEYSSRKESGSQFSAVVQGHVGARANSAISLQTEKVFGKKSRQTLTFKSTSNTVQDVRRAQDIAAATSKVSTSPCNAWQI